MHPMLICRALVCLLALSPVARAAPVSDLANELCALALTNRPVDQLRARQLHRALRD